MKPAGIPSMRSSMLCNVLTMMTKKSFQSSINSDKGHGHHGQHGGSGHAKHHNGHHQLDTPEGTVRRLSLKEESPSPQPSPRLGDEEQVPLTPSAALPVIPEQ